MNWLQEGLYVMFTVFAMIMVHYGAEHARENLVGAIFAFVVAAMFLWFARREVTP